MDEPLRTLVAKDQILDVLNQLFVATDRRDWPAVRACFSSNVRFDMTSVTGGEPALLAADQIVAGWAEALRKLEAIHHQAGNYRVRVDGDRADAFCYGTATHYRRRPDGRNTRTFVGSYDLHLQHEPDGWRIDGFRFTLKFLEGNAELHEGD